MYFRVEWTENGAGTLQRVYWTRNFNTLWRVIKHMNIERRKAGRPVMSQIKIKTFEKYEGGFSVITDDYDANMAIDAERNGQ